MPRFHQHASRSLALCSRDWILRGAACEPAEPPPGSVGPSAEPFRAGLWSLPGQIDQLVHRLIHVSGLTIQGVDDPHGVHEAVR
jgi:hypothetical protein